MCRARASAILALPACTYKFTCNAGEDAGSEAHMVAQHLLLNFLADRHQQKDTALSLSARTFLTCRLFADELTSLRAAAALTQRQQAQLLVKYHNTSEQLEKGLVCDLNAGGLANNNFCSFSLRTIAPFCLISSSSAVILCRVPTMLLPEFCSCLHQTIQALCPEQTANSASQVMCVQVRLLGCQQPWCSRALWAQAARAC